MPDTSFFYCERCGAATFLGGTRLGAHYCPGCRLYTCHDCWIGDVHRCVLCAAEKGKRAGGITVAREMLASLRGVRGELSAIAAREATGDEPSAELDIERRLLGIKSASLAAAIGLAVGDAQVRHAVTARSLRRSGLLEMERISNALAAPARPARRASPIRTWLATLTLPKIDAPSLPRLALPKLNAPSLPRMTLPRIDSGLLRMAAPVAVVLVVTSALGVLLVTRPPGTNQGVAGSTPTPEGQVAGGLPTLSPRPTSTNGVDASPAAPVRLTFDELITDAAPDGWQVLAGTASGVPFPNAVDRSVRLRTGADAAQASFCTPLPEGDARFVTVDLFADAWAGTEVTLQGAGGSFGLQVGDNLLAVVQPGGAALLDQPMADAGWYQAGFSLDPDANLVEIALSPQEDAGGFHTEPLPAGWTEAPPTDARLCISAPPAPGGELYVDNVIIE